MDLFVAFQLEKLGNSDTAIFANTAEVIAFKVGDHDQFGNFLDGGDEIVGIALVELGIGPPGRVPLIGRVTIRLSLSRRKHSGDAEAICVPRRSRNAA